MLLYTMAVSVLTLLFASSTQVFSAILVFLGMLTSGGIQAALGYVDTVQFTVL
jgi:hypothetical protein